MMAMRVHKASHSSMLPRDGEGNVCLPRSLARSIARPRPSSVVFSPVRRQDDRAPLFDDAQDAVPQEAAGFGVHPRGRLVLQQTEPL